MKFLLGVAIGALGVWAYKGGRLQSLMGGAPAEVQQVFTTASERVQQTANSDPVRQAASFVQDKMQSSDAPQIARPSATEVASRPSEPLP